MGEDANHNPAEEVSGDEPTADTTRQKSVSGRMIDRYRLLHVIGEGGMATVYAALQPRPRRTVALKVLKPGVVDDTAIRRFRREAEILARLRHPSIAQVYDAGTYEQDGRTCPYFVMEFIPGAKTILEYVAQKQLNRRDRLKLFVNVCRAVQYGHQHRILHRDLKPANILIDQSGRLKIIDFGVASAPDLRVSGTTMNTEAGRLVGTLQYMSPEQVSADPQNIDVRSDVYALGVLLYKLMTGSFPCTVEGQPIYEAVRIIREDEPVRPSRRDSDLRGDLETIILRAIAKDRAQRYQSVGDLGADVVRQLNRQPIRAKSAGVGYRSRLWVQRQRRLIVASLVILLLVGAGIGGTAWWLSRDASTGDATASTDASDPSAGWGGAEGGFGGVTVRMQPVTLNRQSGRITALTFDASGTRLASIAADSTLVVWDMQSSKALATHKEYEHDLIHTVFSADSATIITLTVAGELFLHETGSSIASAEFAAGCGSANDLAADTELNRIAVACGDSTVRVYDGAAHRWLTLRGTTGPFHSTAASDDGRLILGGSQHGDVYIWNAETGERRDRLEGLSAPVVCVTFAGQPQQVIAIDENGRGRVWRIGAADDPASAAEATQPDVVAFDACESPVVATSVSASGQWLAAASSNSVRLWDLRPLNAGNAVVQHGDTIRFPNRIFSVGLDANAQRLAVGRLGGTLEVFAVADLFQRAAQSQSGQQ